MDYNTYEARPTRDTSFAFYPPSAPLQTPPPTYTSVDINPTPPMLTPVSRPDSVQLTFVTSALLLLFSAGELIYSTCLCIYISHSSTYTLAFKGITWGISIIMFLFYLLHTKQKYGIKEAALGIYRALLFFGASNALFTFGMLVFQSTLLLVESNEASANSTDVL